METLVLHYGGGGGEEVIKTTPVKLFNVTLNNALVSLF